MKKVFVFALMLVLGVSVVACQTSTTAAPTTTAGQTTAAPTTAAHSTTAAQTTAQPTTAAPTTSEQTTTEPQTTAPTTAGDTVAPVIEGADDITIYLNATFDPLAGVTATDDVDGDITANITYVGTVNTAATGVYFLKYSVTDAAGNKTEVARYVTVEVDPNMIGDEMVQNGDFSLGWTIWHLTTGNEGGAGTASVVDGVAEINVTAVSGGLWEPRLESNVMEFVNGTTYEITFDAKADAARSVHVQIGQLLSAAPYFVDYKPGQTEIFDLSTDWQTFTFKFTMNQDTGDGQLLFEMGTVLGNVGTDNLLTTIYYDNIAITEAVPDPDTAKPVFSGVDDVTIETGTTFDPLAGVSAFDLVDGNIDYIAVFGTVDTATPGDYEVIYTAWDNAGNVASAVRIVTVVDLIFNETNLVVNGDFSAPLGDPAEWTLYEANWDPGSSPMSDGTLSIVDGALQLEVVDIGTWGYQGWLLQAMQDIDFQVGQTYKVVFDAKAAAARDINVSAGFSDASSNWHGSTKTVTLGTDYQTYEFIFTVTEDNAAYVEQLKFEFGQAADTVTIDNVDVLVLQQPAGVQNADFSQIGWDMWAQDWDEGTGPAAASMEVVNGELVFTVDNTGNYFWSVQLFQDNIALVPGTEYTVTFDAKSSVARDINFVLITDTENRQTFNLTTDMQTYTFTFTYEGTALTGKADFELGNISAASVPAVITLDNFAITDSTAALPVVNGDFNQVPDWNLWAQDWDEGTGTAVAGMQVVNGELQVTVDNLGNYNWSVQLFQEGLTLVEGAQYTIVFSAKADVARDINFKLIDENGAEFLYVASLTTDMQVFTYTFTYDGTGSAGKVDFELGVIGDAVAGTITFDNVLFFRNFNEPTA